MQAPAALAAPLRPQLPVVRLHVTVELPRVVGNLDVDRWQASIVPFRFAAWVHAYLSTGANVYFQYEPVTAPAARPGPEVFGSARRPSARRVAPGRARQFCVLLTAPLTCTFAANDG
jgi:hypothetical protein